MPDNFKDLLNSLTAPMWKVEPVDLQRIAKEAAAAIESLTRELAAETLKRRQVEHERDCILESLAALQERGG